MVDLSELDNMLSSFALSLLYHSERKNLVTLELHTLHRTYQSLNSSMGMKMNLQNNLIHSAMMTLNKLLQYDNLFLNK